MYIRTVTSMLDINTRSITSAFKVSRMSPARGFLLFVCGSVRQWISARGIRIDIRAWTGDQCIITGVVSQA